MFAEEEAQTPFHVVHKVPAGDGLYVRAKHVQLVERNPDKAIALFRAALEAGDRVDSALKDMAIVLKQQNRPHDAILAISTFRTRCSDATQDSLDNVLLDLYKSTGCLDDQIALLLRKLRLFHNSQTFNGRRTKTARSQGKKFQVSVEQEVSRLLGNLGWAYMQQSNYTAAESVYRRALALEVDNNKVCNLGVCLMKQGRAEEAIAVLEGASYFNSKRANSESHSKSYERAQELIRQASSMLICNHRLHSDGASSAASTSSCDSLFDCWHERAQMHSPTNRSGNSNDSNACSHINSSNNEDARKMSERVAAAWMRECNGKQEGDGGDSAFLRPQMHARRRLPVFQDITICGSAAVV
eukprot:c22745_g1_i2 orf=147-1214(+)